MLPIAGAFDSASFWENLATFLGAAALWAQHKAEPDRDPVDELTYRLRNPVRHGLLHPIVTLRRKADRRRSV